MTTSLAPATCPICLHAQEHGSWPTEHLGTHCSASIGRGGVPIYEGCHRSWTSKVQSHCTVCHRHFGSDSAGDAHRPGRNPTCQDPEGFPRWETPTGPVWGGHDPVAAAERLRAAREGALAGADSDETGSA